MVKTAGRLSAARGEFGAELCRKGIHVLIALVPFLAELDRSHTALLLMGGILLYTSAESLRFLGFSPPLISSVTVKVLRDREKDGFALGPITLGLGALLSLLLFPPHAAAVAVYVLAFGDSAATLVGRFFGRLRPAFLSGKSIEGSLVCFAVSAFIGYLSFQDLKTAVIIGLASMLAEAFSCKDFDNLLLPMAAGLAVLVS